MRQASKAKSTLFDASDSRDLVLELNSMKKIVKTNWLFFQQLPYVSRTVGRLAFIIVETVNFEELNSLHDFCNFLQIHKRNVNVLNDFYIQSTPVLYIYCLIKN